MIPLEFLFTTWLATTIMSGVAAYVLFQRWRNSLAITMVAIFGASLGMLTFYTANICCDFSLNTMIAWSRWTISVMGLVVLGSSIAAVILNKDKP